MTENNRYLELAGGAPYHDDFDVRDNFMRILFNPSRAVQARELTQLQTILQNQQKVSSDFLFKENSLVDGARISINQTKPAMLVDSSIIDQSWVGEILTNKNPAAVEGDPDFVATKQISITAIDDTIGTSIAVYYDYSGEKPEALENYWTTVGGDQLTVKETFTAMTANCDEGIVYTKSQFIHIPAQEIILTNDNTFQSNDLDGTLYIGYRIQEDIVTQGNQEIVAEEGGETIALGNKLLDPASGSRNFNAPGADRYRIKAVLSAYFELLNTDGVSIEHELTLQDVSYTDAELVGPSSLTDPVLTGSLFPVGHPIGETFKKEFESFIVLQNQKITRDQTEPQFGTIENLLARRTYNESGNYTLEDFNITIEPDSDPAAISVTIGPGTAYVEGYEINKRNSTTFSIPRARQTPLQVLNGARKAINKLTYFVIDTKLNTTTTPDGNIASGGFKMGSGDEVLFKNGKNGTGDTIATGRIHSVERQDTTIAVYFSSVGKLADSLPTLRSFVRARDTATYLNVSLRTIGSNNLVPIYGGSALPLITKIDAVELPENIKNVQWKVSRRSTTNAIDIGGGQLEITLIVPSDSTLNSTRPISFIYNATQNKYLDPIENTEELSSISKGVSENISLINVGGLVSAGDEIIVDYILKRTNVAADPDTFTRTKTLQSATVTKTIPDGNNIIDRIELDHEDIYEITKIVQTTNVLPELADNYSDPSDPDHNETLYPTSNFNIRDGEVPRRTFTHDDLIRLKFNDGQTDEYYDKGSIEGWKRFWSKYKNTGINGFDGPNTTDPKNGIGGIATIYEITYHYFRHDNSSNAAFTVNSYANAGTLNREFQNKKNLIPSYISETAGQIDLIGVIDFRRKKSALENGLNESIQDKIIPGSVLTFDIEHNFGRFDSISLHKNGDFVLKQGIPSRSPNIPQTPESAMNMFNLYLPPYTFAASDVQVEAFKNSRYTMKDISRLENRIERLEDSVSLNLLEKSALDMKITDASGIDRFKSGIFVDNFEGLKHTNSLDDNFYIAVDRLEKVIHCPVEKQNLVMLPSEMHNDYAINEFQLTDTKIKKYENIITIAPTGERILAENKTATGFMNLNPYLFYTWVGTVKLTPAVDTWHEEKYLPTQNVISGSWNPPAGFNSDWVVDDIDISWIGIPGVLPPTTQVVPPTSPPSAPTTQWQIHDVVAQPQIFQNIFNVISDPNSTQGQLDNAVQQANNWVAAGEQVTGNGLEWFNQAFLGNEGWWQDTSVPLEERQTVLNELMNTLTFNGSQNTSANLGSNNILSSSSAKNVATTLGSQAFNSTAFHEQNTGNLVSTHELRDQRLVFDANFSSPVNSSQTFSPAAQQQITTTEVKDVLTKHTETVAEDRVVDKTLAYWMRPRKVEFEAAGLRPGMKVFGALDNKQVKLIPNTNFLDTNNDYRVNGNGELQGWFVIPPQTFTTGTKSFLLMDAEATSQASNEYQSSGVLTTRQKTITSIRSVSVKQIKRTTTDIQPLPSEPIGPPETINSNWDFSNATIYSDPVAQSFLVTTKGGCMLKGIDLYFATKSGDFSEPETVDNAIKKARLEELFPGHPSDAPQPTKPFFTSAAASSDQTLRAPVSIYLVEMQDGNPTQNIVPLSQVTKAASEIQADPDTPQNGLTEFLFNDPIFLDEGEEYAIVLASPSKEYNVWVTRLGEQDLFEGGRDNPGVGVATQPYLGSIFKSQNSFTWTPEQETTLSFRLKRYVYPTSGSPKVYLVDSKYEEISDEIVNNSLTATKKKYLDLTTEADKFTGDVNEVMTRVANIYPMIGTLTVPSTNIQWAQAFDQSTILSSINWIAMQNMKRNKLLNPSASSSSNEYIIDNTNNYHIQAELSTSNTNVSPILDMDQCRAIAIRNKVRGIEPFFNYPSGGVSYQANTAYEFKDLLKDPNGNLDDPFYFVSNINGLTASTLTFQQHLNNGNLRILEQEINLPESTGIVKGNAGVYISKTINLKDTADDIRLVLESTEPGQSYCKPYYKILDQNNRFVEQKENTYASNAVNGQTSNVFYTRVDTANSVVYVTDQNTDQNTNQVTVNGINPETGVIYITAVSRQNAFTMSPTETYLNTGPATEFVVSHSNILKQTIAASNTIPFWTATPASGEYTYNEIVYLNNAFWYAEGYMVPEWAAGSYSEGARVRYAGSNWLSLTAANITTPGASADWQEVTDILYFPVGTKPSDGGQGWSKIPTVTVKGADLDAYAGDNTKGDAPGIQIDTSESIWRPMVLRGTKFPNNEFTDGRFYESEWIPRSNPGIEFKNFAIKIEQIARNSKVNIPKCKNVRVVATI